MEGILLSSEIGTISQVGCKLLAQAWYFRYFGIVEIRTGRLISLKSFDSWYIPSPCQYGLLLEC